MLKCCDQSMDRRHYEGDTIALSFRAEANFDARREDKGEHTGGIPWRMLRMLRVPPATKPGAKGARPSYDALNRFTSIQFPSDTTQNVTFTYDVYATNDPPPPVSFGIGRLTKRVDPSGTYVFYYDAQGNLTTERKTISNVLYITQYGYNGNKTLTSITYPSGRVVTYTRDGAGRISQVDTVLGGTSKTLASNITYLPFGDITGLTYGNNISLTRNHDTQYRVTSITAGSVLNLTYGHDAAGNVTTPRMPTTHRL